ncbi:hypothetical protein AB0K53_16915 [Streptomyces tuirus]|uniref:hypothetical protein n=1 Tax=Streptomyces tuirus TaxID=68278 RepID=UPI00343E5BCA
MPAPSQATLYRLLTNLTRPSEQIQDDTTRLDVLTLYHNGRPARPELTITAHVTTRATLAPPCCARARPKPCTRHCYWRTRPSHTPPAPPSQTSSTGTTPRTPPPAAGHA